jgi:hypothetical protein
MNNFLIPPRSVPYILKLADAIERKKHPPSAYFTRIFMQSSLKAKNA